VSQGVVCHLPLEFAQSNPFVFPLFFEGQHQLRVRLLANLSHFVIVDITNPRSAPLELQALVQDYMVPFVPILEKGQAPFAMFVDLQNKYDWVLPAIVYPSVDRLIEVLKDEIIGPAQAKFDRLLERRANELRTKNV
jgi:hypothetical protein